MFMVYTTGSLPQQLTVCTVQCSSVTEPTIVVSQTNQLLAPVGMHSAVAAQQKTVARVAVRGGRLLLLLIGVRRGVWARRSEGCGHSSRTASVKATQGRRQLGR